MNLEVAWEQGQKIRELVEGGMTPDEAYRTVTQAKVPKVKADVVVENKPKKKHKYGAIPTEADGIRFDSKKEAARYQELKLMEQAGAITNLVLQPKYPLHAMRARSNTFTEIGSYVADFKYTDTETGEEIVEDVKGMKTPLYKWKKKHVESQYNIKIREV